MQPVYLSFCSFALSGFIAVSAQDSPHEIPPPTAPLVAPVPQKAQWTITVDYGDKPAAPNSGDAHAAPAFNPGANPLTEIQSIKTGRLKQDILIYKAGTRQECWYVGNTVLSQSAAGNIVALTLGMLAPDVGNGNPMAPYIRERGNLVQSPGFPGLDWVNLKYYDKVVVLDKVPCYHYAFMVGSNPFAEAWIDAQTKLPVKYAGSGIDYNVVFSAPPTGDLTLPPAFSQTMSASERILNHSRDLESQVGR
jgi:hypothetical protein